MKLSHTTVFQIERAVTLAKIFGIDDVIIETGCVRGMDHKQTVIMLQTENVADLEFESLGLNRLPMFTSRLDLAIDKDGFQASASLNGSIISSIEFKAKGLKIDYRAANPSKLKAPKAVKDQMGVEFAYTKEQLELLNSAARAMAQNKDSNVTIIKKQNTICVELSDENGDKFELELGSCVNLVDSAPDFFAHRYPINTLMTVMKQGEHRIQIGERQGVLNVPIQDFNIYIIPVQ